jgi:hypothetical protein
MSSTTDSPSPSRSTFQCFGQVLHLTCLIVLSWFLSSHSLLPVSGSGWTASNLDAAFDPINRRGRNPVERQPPARAQVPSFRKSSDALQAAAGAGSSNFQLTVPVLNLPGRGIDLALALTYNSRVWTGAGSFLFDADADWPAPGWSLGFGKLLDAGDGNAGLYSRTVAFSYDSNGLLTAISVPVSMAARANYFGYTTGSSISRQ